ANNSVLEKEQEEDDNISIGENMLSVAKVYSEFIESRAYIGFGGYHYVSNTVMSAGSAVIWSVDESAEGYTYLVTNYHVVYDKSADTTKNGGNIAKNINIYLYGSEGTPTEMTEKDENGYTQYDYGDYAVKCEYVGGSIEADIAVLKMPTSTIKAVNKNIKPVTLSDSYYVGQTAIAIGNPEDGGISVTRGIVSVESDYIALKIDNTARYYRSIRIDTALYSGNSGGGLFDVNGKLIGITNAGDTEDQNINFAIPIEIVKGTVENILYYYDGTKPAEVQKVELGVDITTENSVYVYDYKAGYGKIVEEVAISSITEGSIAESLQLAKGDIITGVTINGVEYSIERSFNISDILLGVRAGDNIAVKYKRDGKSGITQAYQISTSDLSIIS
ncbi:MAG: S1C family serine protease, partial [Clostridia bacterium]|nr:S1C family serine protease [Clostridia bacterium]